MSDLIVYVITRAEVERCDTTRFLADFHLSGSNRKPRWPMGRVMYTVHGYEDSPDELYSIPEVQAYFAKAHRQWPCWLYYSELMSDCLKIIAVCVIESIEERKVAGERMASVTFDLPEIVRFLDDGFVPLSALTLAAELDDRTYSIRLEAVMNYFGISE